MHHHYHICRRNIGKCARIHMRDGRVLSGRIGRVTSSHCFLTPMGGAIANEHTQDEKRAIQSVATKKKKEAGSEVFFFGGGVVPLAAIAGITFIGIASFGRGGRFGHGGARRGLGRGYGGFGFW